MSSAVLMVIVMGRDYPIDGFDLCSLLDFWMLSLTFFTQFM
jgi:hypothetical protein